MMIDWLVDEEEGDVVNVLLRKMCYPSHVHVVMVMGADNLKAMSIWKCFMHKFSDLSNQNKYTWKFIINKELDVKFDCLFVRNHKFIPPPNHPKPPHLHSSSPVAQG